MAWKKERSSKNEIQWGFKSNSSGIGTYLRYSDADGQPKLRKWSGNSLGFPHSGGNLGTRQFQSKSDALRFARRHMRKYPSYTKDGNVVDIDGNL